MAVESKFHETVAWIKGHPYATAGAVFIGGAILVYLYYSGGTGTSATPANTTQSDYLKAQLVSEATQAQYGAQLGALQAQEQGVATQVQGAVAIDANRNAASVTIAGLNDAVLNQRTAGAVSIAGLQSSSINQQTSASLAATLAQIGATKTVDLAQIAGAVDINQQNTGAAVDIAGKNLIATFIPFAAALSAQNRTTFGVGGSQIVFDPTTGSLASGQTSLTPNVLASQGFTPTQINNIFGTIS
jgi:hypothetical protein